MKTSFVLLSFLAIGIGTIVFAQSSKGTTWRTNNDDITVSGITSFQVAGDADGIDIDFKGSPLLGVSKSQQMQFESNALLGRLLQDSSKKFFLEEGRLSGGVTITRIKTGANQVLKTASLTIKETGSQQKATFTLPSTFTLTEGANVLRASSGSANLAPNSSGDREFSSIRVAGNYDFRGVQTRDQQSETIHLVGTSAVIDNISSGGTITGSGKMDFDYSGTRIDSGQKVPVNLDFRSSGGVIDLPKGTGSYPIQMADLKGPITITVNTLSAPNSNGQQIPTKIVAKGNRLRFSGGVLSLSGSVTVDLDQGQTMSLNGELLEVTFTRDMKVKKWGVSGGPAKIEVKPDGDGR